MSTNTEPQWWQKQLEAQEKSGYRYEPGFGAVPEKVTIRNPEPDGISLNAGTDEMLRVEKNGFYIRGVKVPQDDKEAEVVYNAFKEWLTWAQLSDIR